jgi:hypothetical protein
MLLRKSGRGWEEEVKVEIDRKTKEGRRGSDVT